MQTIKERKESVVAQLRPILYNPMDCSPPEYWQEYWSSELPFPSLGDLHDPGIELMSAPLADKFFTVEPPGKPVFVISLLKIL